MFFQRAFISGHGTAPLAYVVLDIAARIATPTPGVSTVPILYLYCT